MAVISLQRLAAPADYVSSIVRGDGPKLSVIQIMDRIAVALPSAMMGG
jgi:hypothetical protein